MLVNLGQLPLKMGLVDEMLPVHTACKYIEVFTFRATLHSVRKYGLFIMNIINSEPTWSTTVRHSNCIALKSAGLLGG